MKTLNSFLWLILFIYLSDAFLLEAQVKEVPVTTSSKEAMSSFLEGRENFENIELSAAASLFDKAITQDPQFAMAYLYRSLSGGGFNISRQNLDKAENLSARVSEGEKLEIMFVKAGIDGNNQKVKEYLDQLLKLYPEDKRVQMFAVNYYYGLNDFKNALVHLSNATDIDKNYAPAYNLIGYCYSAMSNFKEAEKAFQTYIKLVPDKANPYDSYAELLLTMGKYDESIAQYRKAIEKNPDFITSLLGIANNYIFKGDFESARKVLQDYFNTAPTANEKLTALFNKAISYVHEGKIPDALVALTEYRTMSEKENLITNSIMSFIYQGFILSETGKPLEGITFYEKANNLIGKSGLPGTVKENFEMDSMLWHFYFLMANSDLINAQAEAEKCKTMVESRRHVGEEMFFNGLLGLFEIKKGNYDSALEYLSKADQTNPWIWFYTSVAYDKKGDNQSALKLLHKISSYNVNSLNLALVRKNAAELLKK